MGGGSLATNLSSVPLRSQSQSITAIQAYSADMENMVSDTTAAMQMYMMTLQAEQARVSWKVAVAYSNLLASAESVDVLPTTIAQYARVIDSMIAIEIRKLSLTRYRLLSSHVQILPHAYIGPTSPEAMLVHMVVVRVWEAVVKGLEAGQHAAVHRQIVNGLMQVVRH